jgi:RNA polymerase sigma-70 factor, ECF subfamily
MGEPVSHRPPPLAETFLAGAAEPLRAGLAGIADLESRLDAMVRNARAQWPQVAVAPEAFLTYVAARLDPAEEPVAGLETIHGEDLYLACACTAGDPRAVATFDHRFMSEVEMALSRMRMSAATLDEIKQLVRQRLFVAADGGSPRIAEYSGRSGLRRWVRSVAVRTGLNFLRQGRRELLVEDDRVLDGVAATEDPEIAYMKEKYRREFREAFLAALDRLQPRQQGLLRYHYVDGLNIDEIGTIYRVHRVTAYRWLEKARDDLVRATGEILQAKLRVGDTEFDSILRMIRSQLHVSLQRYLQDREPE